jgi:DNA-directed RNA polymerase specialized sigma24 family protein
LRAEVIDNSCGSTPKIFTINDDAFDLAVVDIGARLPAYFGRRIRDAAAADDLAQETLLRVELTKQ